MKQGESEEIMNITVYCGANMGNHPVYEEAARKMENYIHPPIRQYELKKIN